MHLRILFVPLALLLLAGTADGQVRQNVYVVQAGDTLFRIASEHDMTVAELRRLNNLDGDLIVVGQRLRLTTLVPVPPRPIVGSDGRLIPPAQDVPTPPEGQPQPTEPIQDAAIPPGDAETPRDPEPASDTLSVHVVQPGETLFAIAMRYNTTVDALRTLNGIRGDIIEAGRELRVSGPPPARTRAPERVEPFSLTNTTVPADLVHYVQPGETLFSIAARLNVSLDELLASNDLTTAPLEPGTLLHMPHPIDLRLLAERGRLPLPDTTGLALVYPPGMRDRRLAGGVSYDPEQFVASHRTLPLGSVILVTNPANDRSTFVQVMDRGPVSQSYLIELSEAAAAALELDPDLARRVEIRRLP